MISWSFGLVPLQLLNLLDFSMPSSWMFVNYIVLYHSLAVFLLFIREGQCQGPASQYVNELQVWFSCTEALDAASSSFSRLAAFMLQLPWFLNFAHCSFKKIDFYNNTEVFTKPNQCLEVEEEIQYRVRLCSPACRLSAACLALSCSARSAGLLCWAPQGALPLREEHFTYWVRF